MAVFLLFILSDIMWAINCFFTISYDASLSLIGFGFLLTYFATSATIESTDQSVLEDDVCFHITYKFMILRTMDRP